MNELDWRYGAGFLTGAITIGLLASLPINWQDVKEWQTLIAAGGAFAGAGAIMYQVNREARRRRQIALAGLPQDLSNLVKYCTHCALIAAKKTPGYQIWYDNVPEKPPEFPAHVVERLQSAAANIGGDTGNDLADILASLQIQAARFYGQIEAAPGQGGITAHSGPARIRDAAALYLMVEPLFDVARRDRKFRKVVPEGEFKRVLSIFQIEPPHSNRQGD